MHANSTDILLHSLLGGILALYSLLAVWAALSPNPHWFFRLAALVILTAVWIPIEAAEVTLYLLLQSALTITLLWVFRAVMSLMRRRQARQAGIEKLVSDGAKLKLTLADLLLGVAILAALLAVIRSALLSSSDIEWFEMIVPLLVTSGVTLAALLTVLNRWARRWQILCWVCFVPVVIYASLFYSNDSHDWLYPNRLFEYSIFIQHYYEQITLVSFAAIVVLTLALFVKPQLSQKQAEGSSSSKAYLEAAVAKAIRVGRPVMVLIGTAALMVLGYLYWKMATPPAVPTRVPIEPNGYLSLVDIAQPLSDYELYLAETEEENRKVFVTSHSGIVGKVRASFQDDASVLVTKRTLIHPLRRFLNWGEPYS